MRVTQVMRVDPNPICLITGQVSLTHNGSAYNIMQGRG